jgi:NADPH-dependent curcumin reductase CurA
MPGLTAWFGLHSRGKPVAGETLVVSGAAGAVGSIVGQVIRTPPEKNLKKREKDE